MSNLVFFELLNRFDISAYLFGITSILLFAFTYKLSLKAEFKYSLRVGISISKYLDV